jgi:hypothetical protein
MVLWNATNGNLRVKPSRNEHDESVIVHQESEIDNHRCDAYLADNAVLVEILSYNIQGN